jgi:drug/metabolite transporter (DMT)-like permease
LLWGAWALLVAAPARVISPLPTLFWTCALAVVPSALVALPSGLPSGSTSTWVFAILAGVSFFVAILCFFVAIQGANVSLVAPILACDGAIAAILAAVTGSTLPLGASAALALMVVGIFLVARPPDGTDEAPKGPFALTHRRPIYVTVALAAGSALTYGLTFFFTGEANDMDAFWLVAISRTVSALCAFAVILTRGGVRVPPSGMWKYIVPACIVDVVGYILFVHGTRHEVSVTAVAASQYAVVAALGGVILFKEQMSGLQRLGIATLVVAVGAITVQLS